MSIDTSFVSAYFQSKSQDKATSANKRNARNTNAANLLLSLMMRGGAISEADARRFGLPKSVVGKSAAILPYYLNDLEERLGMDTKQLYDVLFGPPEDQLAQFTQDVDRFAPAFGANEQLVIDAATGEVSRQMLDESQPVFAARRGVAEARKNAALESLRETLNEIDAIQARKGFSGDSFGNRLLKFNARRGIAQDAATETAAANLENALEERVIREAGRNLRFGVLGLPETMVRSRIDRTLLPAESLVRRTELARQPLQFFNIGPGAASQFERFTTPASTSPWQLLAQAAGGAQNMAADFLLQRQLQKQAQYRPQENPWVTAAIGAGTYAPVGGGLGGFDYTPPVSGGTMVA